MAHPHFSPATTGSASLAEDAPPVFLSVVVPCFNEEESIEQTDARLRAVLSTMPGRNCEIVYVNDGSRDRTEHLLDGMAARPGESVRIRVVHFSRNFGHSAAVLAGLTWSRGDHVAIIDADLQDPPELLPAMCKALADGADVVYGQRVTRNEGAFKRVTAWGFYRLINWLSDTTIPKDTGDFRVMTRPVVNVLLECREHDPFMRGLVAWVGFRQQPFPYHREERKFGTTKYPLSKMIRFAGTALLAFSTQPLLLGMYLSALGIVGAFAVTAWALVEWLRGETVAGWTSLVVAYMTGQSIVLGVLGIFGAYLARLFREVQNRPKFVVRRTRDG